MCSIQRYTSWVGVTSFLVLICSYRVRESYEESAGLKVAVHCFSVSDSCQISKDVKQLRDYEITLVTLYKRFIKLLEDIIQTNGKNDLWSINCLQSQPVDWWKLQFVVSVNY